MTARKVVLHVGAPKTGTTYIEKIIWRNQRRLLKRDGIWMPGRSKWDHDALMGAVRGGIWHDPEHPWTWERLVEEAHQRDEVVLVSKEMFAGATRAQVDRALAGFAGMEVHIVITCRALSAALPSAWQQGLKANYKISFGDFLEEISSGKRTGFWRHHDPVNIARRWATDLPADRVHIITMPASKSDPTLLWRRFAEALGIDPAPYSTPESAANESLAAAQAELLRRVAIELDDEFPLRHPWRDAVQQGLIQPVLLKVGEQRKFGVPAAYHPWVRERSQQMIEDLAAYPCDLIGDLTDLEPRLDPDALSPDEVGEAELNRVAVTALAEMVRVRNAERKASGAIGASAAGGAPAASTPAVSEPGPLSEAGPVSTLVNGGRRLAAVSTLRTFAQRVTRR